MYLFNYARTVAAMQDSSFTMAAAAVFSVIIADLFQAKTVEYSVDVASRFFEDEAIGKEGCFQHVLAYLVAFYQGCLS